MVINIETTENTERNNRKNHSVPSVVFVFKKDHYRL